MIGLLHERPFTWEGNYLVTSVVSMSMCGHILYMLWSSGYSWLQILLMWNPFYRRQSRKNPRSLTFDTGLTTAFPTLIDISLTVANCCLVPRMINSIFSSFSLSRFVFIHDLVSSMQASRWLIQCDCAQVVPVLNDI